MFLRVRHKLCLKHIARSPVRVATLEPVCPILIVSGHCENSSCILGGDDASINL